MFVFFVFEFFLDLPYISLTFFELVSCGASFKYRLLETWPKPILVAIGVNTIFCLDLDFLALEQSSSEEEKNQTWKDISNFWNKIFN